MEYSTPEYNQKYLIARMDRVSYRMSSYFRGFSNLHEDPERAEIQIDRMSSHVLSRTIKELHDFNNVCIDRDIPLILPFVIGTIYLRRIVQGQIDIKLEDGHFGCLVLSENMESIFLTLRRQSLGGPNALTGIPFVTENVPSSVIEPLIRNGAVLIGKTSQSRYSSSARLVSGKYVAFAVSQSDFTMTEQNAAVFHSLYSFSEIMYSTRDSQGIKYHRVTITARHFSDIQSVIGLAVENDSESREEDDEMEHSDDSDTGTVVHNVQVDSSETRDDDLPNSSPQYDYEELEKIWPMPGLGIYSTDGLNAKLPKDKSRVKVLFCFKACDKELDAAIYKLAVAFGKDDYDCTQIIRSPQPLEICHDILRATYKPRSYFHPGGPRPGVPDSTWQKLHRILDDFHFVIAPAGHFGTARDFALPSSMTIPIYENKIIEVIGNQKLSLYQFGGSVMKVLDQEGYVKRELEFAPFFSILTENSTFP